MVQDNSQSDSFKGVLLSSVKTTGFWSFITAIVGIVALVAGGVTYLAIEEIRDFSVSVIIIGLVLLFLALILSPRAIAIFLVGRQGRYGANVIVMTAAFFIIAILINFLLFLNNNRFDVTATRILTLSQQSEQILDNLDGPIKATAFFIPTLASEGSIRTQAADLLNEFKRQGGGNFTYEFIDPELQKSVADFYNVTQFPIIVFEDTVEGRQQQVNSFTEQEFATGILVATGINQKRIYYLTGHNESAVTRDQFTGETTNEGLDFALQGIQNDNYQVFPLNLRQEANVPEDTAVLIISGPETDLDSNEFIAITNYIKGGGRVLAMMDPGTPPSFVALFMQWGVIVGGDNVADDFSNVSDEPLTPMVQASNNQYFSSAASGLPITDQLDSTFFPEAAAVQPMLLPEDQPPFVRFVPLASTSPLSWVESDTEDVTFTPGEDAFGPYFLSTAIVATGLIDETELHDEAKLVIFGDSDFVSNRFYASVNNSDFFLNSVNWLAGDFELISIRAKVIPFRALVVNSRERDFIKWSSWFIPPIFMLFLGSIVWWRRR